MPRPGQAQRGKEPTYDVDSGLPYRTTVMLTPAAACIVVGLAKDNGRSLSGVISEILEHVYVDDDGVAQVRGGPLPYAPRQQTALAFDEIGVA